MLKAIAGILNECKIAPPGTNKRVSRRRPQNEWKAQEVPELRIINDELWTRVQKRQNLLKEWYAESGRKPVNRASSSAYLFSGVLRCAWRGANLIIGSGGGKGARYGCPQHWNRRACSNRITVRSSEVEAQLLAGLQSEVLSDSVVDAVVEGALREIRKKDAIKQHEARIRELEAEIKKLILAISKLEDSDAMLSALKERETELRELKAAKTSRRELTEEAIRSSVQEVLSDIPGLLKKAPEQAKAKLSEHLKEIQMTPQENEIYVHQESGDLLGLRGPVMVAGGGFEPPTFGL